MRRWVIGLAAWSLLLPLVFGQQPPSGGFRLRPMRAELRPMGRDSSRAFHVSNGTDASIAVQMSVVAREIDEEGTEKLTPAEKDFIIYPPQMIVKPKSSQVVRVKWIGDPKPASELAYRLIAEQVAIPEAEGEATEGVRLHLLVRYGAPLYITPKGAKEAVVLQSVSQRAEKEERQLVVVLENRGTTHANLVDLHLHVSAGKDAARTTVDLAPNDLKGMNTENVLAGHTRRFVLPWPGKLGDGPLDAKFEFDQTAGH